MQASPINIAFRQFLKTTTLHGFKYLTSPNWVDRIGWFLCFCASACCAGMLSTVLWSRYLQIPALLTLDSDQSMTQPMPMIAVCLPADHTANYLVRGISTSSNENDTQVLSEILTKLILREDCEVSELLKLEKYLSQQDESLSDLLLRFMPTCSTFVLKCRWFSTFVPCDKLFKKQLTQYGPCCVLPPSRKLKISNSIFLPSNKLSLALKCPLEISTQYQSGCQYFTRFNGENWVYPQFLTAGYSYTAQLTFNTVIDEQAEKLTHSACVTHGRYSRRECIIDCIQRSCGCHDPLLPSINKYFLPPCPISRINCLRSTTYDSTICACLPQCKQVTSIMNLETSPMFASFLALDPLFKELNLSSSVIIQVRILHDKSKFFKTNPTETWLTLLSSLGGVFNMFLGVGLFSALEILFLLIVRLPATLRKSNELKISTIH